MSYDSESARRDGRPGDNPSCMVIMARFILDFPLLGFGGKVAEGIEH